MYSTDNLYTIMIDPISVSHNNPKSYQEFRDVFNNLNSTKAYQPLIIRTLAESYPNLISKGKIAGKIRDFYHNNDSYEQYNIWNTLSDRLGLTREQNGWYGLNVEPLKSEQLRDLIDLSKQKILQAENSDKTQFPKTSQQVTTTGSGQSNNVANNDSSTPQPDLSIDADSDDLDDEIDSTDLDEEYDSDLDEDYFLVRIDVNQKDELNIERLNNYGSSLSKREKRVGTISERKTHKAILFDTKGKFVRIWGYSDMEYKEHPRYNESNLKIADFKPVTEIIGGQVKPNWLREDVAKLSMFGNRRIRKIPKRDYMKILESVVPSSELFKTNDDEYHDANQQSVQYEDDTPLEIPNKDILEKGINKITDELLIDRRIIEEIVIHLASGRNILLAGPIGTGKTHLSMILPSMFWSSSDIDLGYNTEVYTASYEWNVTDVIGGIVPRMSGDKPIYQIQYGCAVETVRRSWQDKKPHNSGASYRGTWLVIDEFNRAEIDKAFGQLFTSLETKMLRIPNSKTPDLIQMKIPKDYRIIGTLNTSDKHHLFKLSDALKRRFAYIEVKSPAKSESEKEIFYALRNAMKELPFEQFSTMVNLDVTDKKLHDVQTNPEFISAIRSAYEILSFLRLIKDMGTAVLKSIYQTMLVGTKIEGYSDNILDIALNGNLIPQLERTNMTSIEVISKFCFEDIHSFFRQMYDTQDDGVRQKYANDFEYYLQFLGILETEALKNKFSKKSIEPDDWTVILGKWNIQKLKSGLPRKLPLFSTSLEDLKKTFEFL